MDTNTELLYDSTVKALSLLGESTTQAFVRELNREHVQLRPDQVDLEGIKSKLSQFFGDGADVIIDRIHDGFMKSILERRHSKIGSITSDEPSDNQNTQKILGEQFGNSESD